MTLVMVIKALELKRIMILKAKMLRKNNAFFSMTKISASEQAYIQSSIKSSIRSDGRSRTCIRQILLSTNVTLQSNGSSRCQLGSTDVLVSTSLSAGLIPGPGRVECTIDGYAHPLLMTFIVLVGSSIVGV